MPNKHVTAKIAELVSILNIEFDHLNSVHFSGRLARPKIEFSVRKSFGGYYQKRAHRIVLSWQAFEEHGLDETLNTFRHEVAHIVHLHHRREFWELAFRLGVTQKYAKNPLKPRFRRVLIYECPSCRNQVRRLRQIRNHSCARCDKKFNPAFKLRLVEARDEREADTAACRG